MGIALTTDLVRELLDYDPATGVFTWRERGKDWFSSDRIWKSWNARYAGTKAGTLHIHPHTDYQCICIQLVHKAYKAHRLAFLWMGEPMPEQVDHRDNDGTNNAWENLIPSNALGNNRNRSRSRANISGVTGVSWNKAKGKWKVEVKVNRKPHHLGYFDEGDIDKAAMAAMEFRAEHGFSPTHGLELAPYHKRHC